MESRYILNIFSNFDISCPLSAAILHTSCFWFETLLSTQCKSSTIWFRFNSSIYISARKQNMWYHIIYSKRPLDQQIVCMFEIKTLNCICSTIYKQWRNFKRHT